MFFFRSKLRPLGTYKNCEQKGFTLIEIILVLVLLGVAGVFATFGMSELTNSFIFTRENTQTAGKAQLAMLRISKELVTLKSVISASASSLRFISRHDTGGGAVNKEYTLSADGSGNLILHDHGAGGLATEDVLTNQVGAFSLAYYDDYKDVAKTTWTTSRKEIGFSLTITGANNVASIFLSRVRPRNL